MQFELASNKRKLDMKQFLDVKKQNLACLEQIVREGQEQGLFRKDVNITLLPSTLIGTYFHFQANRPLYEDLLDLNTDARFETYVTTELAAHIKQTINALLLP
ncbi:TetR/AcrR family transcriptional regulator C-terminal domain-containing protein [Flavobacterium sp. N1718]|uniref:TetR/AcrR family transcriptional regulator C-terminal domain-containing protein n=1 Tax=Flavobacterium sp. N1718 TaxID=2986822 RepID=UPI0029CAB8A5|nr:TetR/AcrR family transcriptional regulator C-terminal domain-containing protein [Flavobacterium sp. N1718]